MQYLIFRDLSFRKSALRHLSFGKFETRDLIFMDLSFRTSSFTDLSFRKCWTWDLIFRDLSFRDLSFRTIQQARAPSVVQAARL